MKIEKIYIVDDEDIAVLRALPENPCTTCIASAGCCGCPKEDLFAAAVCEAKKRIPEEFVEKYSDYVAAIKVRDKLSEDLREQEAAVKAFEEELAVVGLGAALKSHQA